MNAWRSWLRAPALHFVLLGTGAWMAVAALEAQVLPLGLIIVTEDDVARLERDWRHEMNRPPSSTELAASLRLWVDDEMLVQEALRTGMDRRDDVVRERLLMNLRFVWPDTVMSDDELLRQAFRLDMTTRDPVTRRRLLDVMQRRLVRGAQVQTQDVARIRRPSASTSRLGLDLEHRFFNADQRPNAQRDATRCRTALVQKRSCVSDDFLWGTDFKAIEQPDIERMWGRDAASQVLAMEAGSWSQPVRSPYGWHVFRIQTRQPLPAGEQSASLRAGDVYAALALREREVLQDAIRDLRTRYRVDLPDRAPPLPP